MDNLVCGHVLDPQNLCERKGDCIRVRTSRHPAITVHTVLGAPLQVLLDSPYMGSKVQVLDVKSVLIAIKKGQQVVTVRGFV
jgi:hypothetical protein